MKRRRRSKTELPGLGRWGRARRSGGAGGDEPANGPARWLRFLTYDLWHIEVGDLSSLRAFLTRASRVLVIAVRDFLRDRCMQQAAALTYLTIFTLPALLALVFIAAKAFGAFEWLRTGPIETFLNRAFPVDGEASEGAQEFRDLVAGVFDHLQEAELKALGTVGLLFLIYATLKMLGSVERSFNEIWGVHRSRSLVRKFSDYLAIVAIVPIALAAGTALTGIATSGVLGEYLPDLESNGVVKVGLPLLTICAGMTLLLYSLPNTRVRLLPALAGGIVAGVVWQLAQLSFVRIQIGLTNANPILSSFAAVPLLLSWIYISWVTVFLGAELSFAIQNEKTMTSLARTGAVDPGFREALAPRLAGRVAAAFLAGEPPPASAELAAELGVAPRLVSEVLDALCVAGLLVEAGHEEEERFLPARDPDTITVYDTLLAQRWTLGGGGPPSPTRLDERVDRILGGFDERIGESLENHTLRELALALEESSSEEEPAGAEQLASGEEPSR